MEKFHTDNYGPEGADIIIVSDLPEGKITGKISAFKNWAGGHTQANAINVFPVLSAGTLYLVDKPDAAQSEIRIGKRALKYDPTGEYYRAGLMNYTLGGAFNSRINMNLREDKGYTYGARSSFYGNDIRGGYNARAGVRADTTAESIRETVKEINNYQTNGLTSAELAFMKGSLGQRDARAYETPSQKLGFLSQIATYNLSKTFVDEQNEILDAMTRDELNALAAKHLKFEDMILLVVGDKAKIYENLEELGYPIVELDADGYPVK